jgi:hypothetical protein
MALERTSCPTVVGFADMANSLVPQDITAEARLSQSAGDHVGG